MGPDHLLAEEQQSWVADVWATSKEFFAVFGRAWLGVIGSQGFAVVAFLGDVLFGAGGLRWWWIVLGTLGFVLAPLYAFHRVRAERNTLRAQLDTALQRVQGLEDARPFVRLKHFLVTPDEPAKLTTRRTLVDAETRIALGPDQILIDHLPIFAAKAGVKNEPASMNPDAKVAGATATLTYHDPETDAVWIGPLPGVWHQNPGVHELGHTENVDRIRRRDLPPSTTEVHWIDVALKPAETGEMYAVTQETYRFRTRVAADADALYFAKGAAAFEDQFRIPGRVAKVRLQVSGPGMESTLDEWLRVESTEPGLAIERWKHHYSA